MKKLSSVVIASVMAGSFAVSANADEVNIYSYRQANLIEPLLAQFEKETGIKTNVVFAKEGLEERLAREGKHSPADVVLTVDIANLIDLVDRDLTAAPSNADVLAQTIPAQYRDSDNQWYALTMRARNIYSSKERMEQPTTITYEDLADPKYKGKICTRSGKHPYNVALVASMIAHHGEAQTKTWLEGVKANLARTPQGNDREQVKAIKDGLCDLSIGNSYYYGLMLTDESQKSWAEAVYINFPNQQDRGAHVNISGMVLAKYAPNRAAAEKLMAFLASKEAQNLYAQNNLEYPVTPGVKAADLVMSWGEFKADGIALEAIADNSKKAIALIDEVKFDF